MKIHKPGQKLDVARFESKYQQQVQRWARKRAPVATNEGEKLPTQRTIVSRTPLGFEDVLPMSKSKSGTSLPKSPQQWPLGRLSA